MRSFAAVLFLLFVFDFSLVERKSKTNEMVRTMLPQAKQRYKARPRKSHQ
jgi:hypothetical protein